MSVVSIPATRPMSTDDFLAWEREQPGRWEFDGLQPTAAPDNPLLHDRIVENICVQLRRTVADEGGVFGGTHRLIVSGRHGKDSIVCYPDVMVTASLLKDDPTTADAALAVVEVLSPFTVGRDKGDRVSLYNYVESIGAYLLVDPVARGVLLYQQSGTQLCSMLEPVPSGRRIDLGFGLIIDTEEVFEGVA